MTTGYSVVGGATAGEKDARKTLAEMLRTAPIPDEELCFNLGLFTNRQALSRILFMHEIYSRIVNVHGSVMEFGVRWGQNMSLFSAFRGMYEPFNYNRKIIGFDTFGGFPSVDGKDGAVPQTGAYGVAENYQDFLDRILALHESASPIPQKKKYELVKGDATLTIRSYLDEHPETIVALAYFDFDIYAPTKACLEAILPRMPKSAVIGFDELNCPEFPGETLAVLETLSISRCALRRSPLNPLCSYLVLE